jgi:hypothetical protein
LSAIPKHPLVDKGVQKMELEDGDEQDRHGPMTSDNDTVSSKDSIFGSAINGATLGFMLATLPVIFVVGICSVVGDFPFGGGVDLAKFMISSTVAGLVVRVSSDWSKHEFKNCRSIRYVDSARKKFLPPLPWNDR